MTPPGPRLTAWLPLLPAALVLVVWAPALSASFQFDDWAVIVDDPRVQSLAAWWHSMPGMRALLKLSYALNHTLDSRAAGFRAVNIALHAFNSGLVFGLLRRHALRLQIADAQGATFVATVAALVFALHPLQTESVTYVCGRSNVLMASFALLSLRAGLRDGGAVPASLAGLAAALATKETAAVVPLVLLLMLAGGRDGLTREAARRVAPGAGLVLLYFVAGLLVLPYAWLIATSLAERNPWSNLVAQVHGIGHLLGQLWRLDRLNADPMLPVRTTLDLATALSGIALLATIALALARRRRWPALSFGVLWTGLWLAPTNSVLARLDLVNDRQWYLALVGPAWLIAVVLLRVGDRLRAKRQHAGPVQALVIALALTLATATLLRNRVYRTEVSFWQDVVAKSPHNARAANNLGLAHALACEPQAALAAFERAQRLAPDDPRPVINAALLQRGELPGLRDAACPPAR